MTLTVPLAALLGLGTGLGLVLVILGLTGRQPSPARRAGSPARSPRA